MNTLPCLKRIRWSLVFLSLLLLSCQNGSIPSDPEDVATVPTPSGPSFHDIRVDSVDAFRQTVQDLKPGDRILLQDGEYNDSGNLTFTVQGTSEKPVVIQPENPHQVVITGEMSWRIDGQHITFSGLDFIDARSVPTDKPYAGFIYASDTSDSLRFTACRFITCEMELKANGKTKGRLITLHGDHHRFDHCFLYDPIGGGLAIKGPDKINNKAFRGNARIDHNIFREMTRHRELRDQGEALFLGTGFEHRGHRRLGAVVEYNIFDKANGDTHGEIITVKGSDIIFRHNLFVNAPGAWFHGGSHLSLRSTDDCQIYNNLFYRLGCGIWVTGKRHHIYNNLFLDIDHAGLLFPSGNISAVTENEGVTMLDDTYFNMLTTPDVYGKISRGYGAAFRPAEDCIIVHNSFSEQKRYAVIAVDKKNSDKGSLPIKGNVIANNLFESALERRNDPFMHIQYPELNRIAHNIYRLDQSTKLGALGKPALMEEWAPTADLKGVEEHLKHLGIETTAPTTSLAVETDFLGRKRDPENPVIGPFEGLPFGMSLLSVLPAVPPEPGSLHDKPLKSEFKVFPQNIRAGELLVLDAAHSAGDIVDYHWDFGDGSESRSKGNAIAHRWTTDGVYSVTLTVRTSSGESSTTEMQITIGNP